MAAIDGVTLERLEPLLADANAACGGGRRAGVTVALVNARTRVVVAGSPAALDALRARLSARRALEAEERRAGRRGGAPLRFEWTPLAVDVPFHSPALADALERVPARRRPAGPRVGAGARARATIPARAQFVEPGALGRGRRARSSPPAPTGCSISGRAPRSRG